MEKKCIELINRIIATTRLVLQYLLHLSAGAVSADPFAY